jgi:hypothetical protein
VEVERAGVDWLWMECFGACVSGDEHSGSIQAGCLLTNRELFKEARVSSRTSFQPFDLPLR